MELLKKLAGHRRFALTGSLRDIYIPPRSRSAD